MEEVKLIKESIKRLIHSAIEPIIVDIEKHTVLFNCNEYDYLESLSKMEDRELKISYELIGYSCKDNYQLKYEYQIVKE